MENQLFNSLFTNTPLTESVNLCSDLLFHDSDFISYNECKLIRDQVCNLLNFAA